MDVDSEKIDPITALQDRIDGLSLAMFEALRSLRDAVAPESGNLGVAANSVVTHQQQQQQQPDASSSSAEPDLDELWNLYKSGDAEIVSRVRDAVNAAEAAGTPSSSSPPVLPQRREDFVRLYAKMEMEKDTELVTKLASTVLDRSDQIDEQLDALPGMNRTRDEQLKIIEGLISLNQQAARDLEDAYKAAVERRAKCRQFVQARTCEALGIEEEGGDEE